MHVPMCTRLRTLRARLTHGTAAHRPARRILAAGTVIAGLAAVLAASSPGLAQAGTAFHPAVTGRAAAAPGPATARTPALTRTADPARTPLLARVADVARTADPARAAAVAARRSLPGAGVRHAPAAAVWHHYTVRPGDNLTVIASRYYGPGANWVGIYLANRSQISDPQLIYPGQVLLIPPVSQPGAAVSPQGTGPGRQPAAARAPGRASSGAQGQTAGSRAHTRAAGQVHTRITGRVATRAHRRVSGAAHHAAAALTAVSTSGGTLGCAALEALWEQAGGSAREAAVAASIAMAESSGQQYATGSAGERGYWQINPDHGALSTYDPYGNARAAVIISANGTNWSPWTTFTSGAYLGRC